jgi:hypothetical protein
MSLSLSLSLENGPIIPSVKLLHARELRLDPYGWICGLGDTNDNGTMDTIIMLHSPVGTSD